MLTLSEMITDARDHLDANTNFLPGPIVANRLEHAQQEIVRSIVKEDPSFYIQRATLDFVANQALYDLPLNARLGSRILFVVNESSTNQTDLPPANLHDYLALEGTGIASASTRWHFMMENGQVRVSPTPTTTKTGAATAWFIPTHGNMVEGLASAATTTTLSLFAGDPTWAATYGKVSPRDDYYNGMRLYIASGAGAGQIRTITDYAGSTRTCTVDTWDTTPDTTSVACILCPVPEDHHPMVPLRAAMLMSAKNRNRKKDLTDLYYGYAGARGAFFELMGWIQTRQEARLDTVEYADTGH